MNAPSLPTKLTTISKGHHVYVPMTGLTGVPSGYARQAQLEATCVTGFKAYDAQKGA